MPRQLLSIKKVGKHRIKSESWWFGIDCHVSITDRERFITYYLAKGQGLEQEILTQEDNAEIFVDLKEPLNFSKNLFQWTKTKFSLEDEQISELTKRKEVCLSNGWCLKVIDVGSICCPF